MSFRRPILNTLAAALLAGGTLAGASAQAADPIKIGLVAPLTGNVAANGQRMKEGAQLFVEQLNAKGGIEGRKVELLIEDDRNSPKDAATIAQKLVGIKDLPLVIGTFSTTASLAMAPIYAEAKIPQISPTSSAAEYTKQSSYQFRQNNTEEIYAQKNADLVLKRLGLKKIALVYYQDDWGLAASNATKAALEKDGAKILLTEALLPGGKDFRPLVSKIKSLDVEGIYLVSHYGEAAVLMQQLRQAGVTVPVAAAQPLTNPKFIELAGKDADGVLLQTTFFAPNPANKEFSDAYQAKFGQAPDQWAALSYDAAGVGTAAIAAVLKSGKPLTGEAVREALANGAPYKGITGVSKFQNGDVNKETVIITIKNGQYTLAQ
jgi:branched-chain amino acid transport system substrate-binding protein